MKKSLLFSLFILSVFLLKAQTNSVINGYYIKAIKAIVLQNDTIQLKNPVNGQILGRVNGKWVNINKPNDLDTLTTNELQTLQEVTDLGNTVTKTYNTGSALFNKTISITSTENTGHTSSILTPIYTNAIFKGSSQLVITGGDFRGTTLGTTSSYLYGGTAKAYIGSGSTVSSTAAGFYTSINDSSSVLVPWVIGSQTYSRTLGAGGVTHLRGNYVDVENYGTGLVQTSVGVNTHVRNIGGGTVNLEEGVYGKVGNENGGTVKRAWAGSFDIGNYGASSHMGQAVGVYIGDFSNEGTIDTLYGLWVDSTFNDKPITPVDRAIYSQYKALSQIAGPFKMDTLRGTGNRLAMVTSTGQFFATKKDSTYYWNSAYGDIPTSGSVTGTTNKTVSIFQRDGGSFSFNFTDLTGGGSSGGGNMYIGNVTDRNINITAVGFTPANGNIVEVKPDTEIDSGDAITLSINAGSQDTIYAEDNYDIDYRLKLMYSDGKWFVMDRIASNASLKGNVDATNLIVNTDGIQYVDLGEDSFTDNTLVPLWYIRQLISASNNNSTQTLVGTTPYWNVANGKNANITLIGTTTITFANLVDGMEGSLYVNNGSSSSYRITFAGYTVEIYPSVWYSGDEVAVSGSSKKDVFSYKYFGGDVNKVVISGVLDIK